MSEATPGNGCESDGKLKKLSRNPVQLARCTYSVNFPPRKVFPFSRKKKKKTPTMNRTDFAGKRNNWPIKKVRDVSRLERHSSTSRKRDLKLPVTVQSIQRRFSGNGVTACLCSTFRFSFKTTSEVCSESFAPNSRSRTFTKNIYSFNYPERMSRNITWRKEPKLNRE